MLANPLRRAVDLVVCFLALYAFAFVPLGERTGLEHLKAVLRTPAAKTAGHELVEAADRLRQRLLGAPDEAEAVADAPREARGVPKVPKLPRRSAPENAAVVPAASGDNAAAAAAMDAPDASL